MSLAWREIVGGRSAKLLTVALLIIQLAGCAFDLTSHQAVLMSGFCMVTDNHLLATAGIVIGFILIFSWAVGLVSLHIAGLRPVYWLLILMIPLAFAGQMQLVHRQVLSCDAP